MASKRTKARNSEGIQQILNAYERSGLTRRQFCEQVGLPLTTLDSYRRRQAKQLSSHVVPVQIVSSTAAASPAGFTVVLSNGRKIESCWEFPEPALLRLVQTLEQS